MAKPAVLVTSKLPDDVEERLKANFAPTLAAIDDRYDPRELPKRAAGMDGLLVIAGHRVDADTIAKLPDGLRIVATASVGFEHVDLAAAKARGIAVTNTPDVLTDATADLTLFLLLGACRRAREAQQLIYAGDWRGMKFTENLGTDPERKRLGILGMGRIGRAVADRARAFGMEVHYHNRSRLKPEHEKGATYHDSAEALLPHSDILSMHCPMSPETADFLNVARIGMLPEGAIVVNTARGGIVDDAALIAALKSGRIAAAGLDVFANEPKLHPEYLTLPNAFLTPHIGSATHETRSAMGHRAVDNLEAVLLRGAEPGDRVA
ncbi:MAG: D-glycerate dehydrogenase [Acetobacterales bacterium]